MKIALHGLSLNPGHRGDVAGLFASLADQHVDIYVTEVFDQILQQEPNFPFSYQLVSKAGAIGEMDFLISVGGDGTLLDAVCQVGMHETPILGLNTGRLGFLATVSTDQIAEAITNLATEKYEIENRTLISLDCEQRFFDGLNFALNEFTIHKRDTSSMITVHTYIDDRYLNSYWADGLIVSTPTGSTGYSLSCGGPLITPDAKNLVITPVSPHNLNVRPMIVSDDCEISFVIQGRTENVLISLDSRSTSISSDLKLKVRKEKFFARLVKLPNYDFFDTLRYKLNWGMDMRN